MNHSVFSLISFLSRKKKGISQTYVLKPSGCTILFVTGIVILSGFCGNLLLIAFATMDVFIATEGPICTSSKEGQPKKKVSAVALTDPSQLLRPSIYLHAISPWPIPQMYYKEIWKKNTVIPSTCCKNCVSTETIFLQSVF